MGKAASKRVSQIWFTSSELCIYFGVERTTLWRWKRHCRFPEPDLKLAGHGRYDIRKIETFLQCKL